MHHKEPYPPYIILQNVPDIALWCQIFLKHGNNSIGTIIVNR
jgi:hypothetical protein